MKFSRYGITFHFLKEEDIEQVRQWRNDPLVAASHEFKGHITPEMQQEWFRSVNNLDNLYTIVEYHGEKIGVINMKNIDWVARVCEGGIFFPEPKYHQTILPAMVSYIATEIIFIMFEWNMGYARVLKQNTKVQAFVRMLGYELVHGQEGVNNQLYRITRESFEKCSPRVKKAIAVLYGNGDQGVLWIERNEFADPEVFQWEEKVRTSRFIAKVETTKEGRGYYFSLSPQK
jgi:RimJ/RimL family protein N-acetyltransferase